MRRQNTERPFRHDQVMFAAAVQEQGDSSLLGYDIVPSVHVRLCFGGTYCLHLQYLRVNQETSNKKTIIGLCILLRVSINIYRNLRTQQMSVLVLLCTSYTTCFGPYWWSSSGGFVKQKNSNAVTVMSTDPLLQYVKM
jgi:hypothetical protein